MSLVSPPKVDASARRICYMQSGRTCMILILACRSSALLLTNQMARPFANLAIIHNFGEVKLESAIVYIVLNILAVFNIAVLCAFLVFRKNNSLPNYLLALIFLIPGLYFFDSLLICTEAIHSAPYFFFFVQIIANVFPIAVYIYVHLFIGKSKRFRGFLIASSSITILFSFYLVVHFGLLSPEQQTKYITQLSTNQYPDTMNAYNIVFYICQMIYLLVLFLEIRAYRISVQRNLSELESVKLLFVRQFIILMAILNFLLVLFYILLPASTVDYGVLPIVMTFIYLFVIVFSIKNNAIFSHDSYNALLLENQKIYAHQPFEEPMEEIKDERWQRTIEVLEKLIREDQVYKQHTLSLTALSELAQEQPYFVSQILNQHFKKSFFDFINEARIDEAIRLLDAFDAKVDTIENIAEEVGFNSRASFYRSFKKITGKNPLNFVSKA